MLAFDFIPFLHVRALIEKRLYVLDHEKGFAQSLQPPSNAEN
jgi:hypothetical protein